MAVVRDVKQLAAYIQKKHIEDKQKPISAIKMQKSLYFLFAYWGAVVRKSSRFPWAVEEDYSIYDDYLFDEAIEAWVYGPVVPEVYRSFSNISDFYNDKLFDELEKIKDFIDGLLKDLFDVSDFTLVEISHNDFAWKNNFNNKSEYHNNEINKEEIIEEYASK